MRAPALEATDKLQGVRSCAPASEVSAWESDLDAADRALLSVGRHLLKQGYRFTTVSPASHGRVNARRFAAPTLRDIFGWSRPFGKGDLPDSVLRDLRTAGAL